MSCLRWGVLRLRGCLGREGAGGLDADECERRRCGITGPESGGGEVTEI